MTEKEAQFQQWVTYFDESIRRSKLKQAFLFFIKSLIDRDLPIIFETRHLSKHVGIDEKTLNSIVNGTENYYREFRIPKRKGGTRKISTPWPSLLQIQRWILENILEKATLSDSAHGFISGKSIISNSVVHLDMKCLLKIDIENFFPSITIDRVVEVFRYFGYPPNVCFYLGRLCCLRDRLPQGAATSPYLSNIIAKRLDRRLSALAASFGLNYSRYADDLAFSGNHISVKYFDLVDNILNEEGFQVNEEKTKLIRGNGKKIVTGVSVSGQIPKLPKATRRKLKQEYFYILKYGILNHTGKIGINDPIYLERLMGRFSFWKQIEPDNTFVVSALAELKRIQANDF